MKNFRYFLVLAVAAVCLAVFANFVVVSPPSSSMITVAILCLIAFCADWIIKKQWGEKGSRIACLSIAAISFITAWTNKSIIDGLFGLLMLYAARPRTALAQAEVLGQKISH